MNREDYTPEQVKSIEDRVVKAKTLLEELQLEPQVVMQAVNMGDDVFGLKPIPYLQDTRFKSPINKENL